MSLLMRPHFLLCIAILLSLAFGCSSDSANKHLPQSLDEFKDRLAQAYNTNSPELIESLFLEPEIAPEVIEPSKKFMLRFAGKHKITKLDIIPFNESGYKLTPFEINGRTITSTVEPKWYLICETEGNEGFEGGKSTWNINAAIGKSDRGYGMCFGLLELVKSDGTEEE